MKKLGKVYICHHVDTEGPLFESLEATFDRIRFITGLKLEPIRINLEKLRSNWFGLSDKEMLELGPLIDEHSLNFLENLYFDSLRLVCNDFLAVNFTMAITIRTRRMLNTTKNG